MSYPLTADKTRQIYIGFESTQLSFRTDVDEVASSIMASHSSMIVTAVDEIVGSLEVYRANGGYVCRGQNELEYRGDPANLADWLNRDILDQFIRAHPARLWLHAGAVEIAGRAVLIVGKSGQGKSTLVKHLLDSGWNYLSDEMAPVDTVSWEVSPYPRTPVRRVNPGHYVESIVRHPIKRETLPLQLSQVSRANARIGMIAFPTFRYGSAASMRPVSAGEAALKLSASCTNFTDLQAVAVTWIAVLAQTIPCVLLEYGNGVDAASLLNQHAKAVCLL